MTKRHEPGGLSEALFTIGARLTVVGAAEAIGRSPQLYYKMVNTDEDVYPNIRQCLLLDIACMEDGGPAAILDWYQREIGKVGKRHTEVDLHNAALDAITALGRFTMTVREAKSPQSPGAERITENERKQLLADAMKMYSQVEAIVHSLQKPKLQGVA